MTQQQSGPTITSGMGSRKRGRRGAKAVAKVAAESLGNQEVGQSSISESEVLNPGAVTSSLDVASTDVSSDPIEKNNVEVDPRVVPQVSTPVLSEIAPVVGLSISSQPGQSSVSPVDDLLRPVDRGVEFFEASDMETRHQTSVYLHGHAVSEAKRVTTILGINYATLAMDAVDWAVNNRVLEHALKQRRGPQRAESSHFPNRRSSSRHRSVLGGQARVLWTPQFTPSERTVLYRFVHEYGAESLSRLISVCVEAYLLDDDFEPRKVEDRIWSS